MNTNNTITATLDTELNILQQDIFDGHLVTRFTDGVEIWHAPEEDSGWGERRWGDSKVSPWDDPWAEERSWAALAAAHERGIKPRHPRPWR